jgi:DNA topoisomerase I
MPFDTADTNEGRRNGGPSICYSDTAQLNITRRKSGRSWAYYDEAGKRIVERDEIDRLNAIALPPAYRDARFNPDPLGHLQAIGIDARGRKQYRYHTEFRAAQESGKFSLCADFGQALPKLRRTLSDQLSAHPTSREAVLAAMVRILDQAYLRIGNEAYRQSNKSFGLTTLRNRHASLRGHTLQLQYRGKSGIMRSVKLNDRSLSRIVRRCQDLPGQNLFQYRDDDGEIRAISSAEVNGFLRETMGGDFTAKHFRTWHASAIAFEALHRGNGLKETFEEVAQALGNTPAIARKSYIHPLLLQMPPDDLQAVALPRETQWQTRTERGLLALLQSEDGAKK